MPSVLDGGNITGYQVTLKVTFTVAFGDQVDADDFSLAAGVGGTLSAPTAVAGGEQYVLTIAANTSSVDVTVTATDDSPPVAEGSETITATIDGMAVASGATTTGHSLAVAGSPDNSAAVTLADDDTSAVSVSGGSANTSNAAATNAL